MDTNRLLQFRVLAETKNLRKAAEILGISHTGLHKSMGRLEADLGQKLFYTVGRGLELTPFALTTLKKIPEFLSLISSLKDNSRNSKKVFTLGSFEVFSTHSFPVIVKHIKGVDFSLRELGPGQLEEAVVKGDVDLGITYAPVARAGLEIYAVGTVEMGLFCRRHSFEKTALVDLPFVAPRRPVDEMPTTVRGLDGWPEGKVARKVLFEVELMESALALVRAGLAVAYLPKFVADLHNAQLKEAFRLVAIGLPQKFPINVKKAYIVKKQVQKENEFERLVAKSLRDLCAGFKQKSTP